MIDSRKDMVELVDASGNPIGSAPKLDVHHSGELHRALSIFLFDTDGRQLIQQRALSKYHSPGLWSNACCSHPFPGEKPESAAHRRLKEEMGMTATMKAAFVMRYYAQVGNGLIEHEFDHIFTGITNAEPKLNPDEVESFAWLGPLELASRLESEPEQFTPWFKMCLNQVYKTMGISLGVDAVSEIESFSRVEFL